LANAFARELGVTLQIRAMGSTAELREALASGHVDIVAAGVTPGVEWRRVGRPTDSYQEIAQIVVARRTRGATLKNVAALKERQVVVRADSAQDQVLEKLRDNGAPWLDWRALSREEHDPLVLVENGDADYAIVDSNEFPYLQHVHPSLGVVLTLPDPREAHWIVPRRAVALATRVDAFLATQRSSGRLAAMLRSATPESPDFEFLTARRLQADIEEQLPHLWPHFNAAAAATGVDWRLLAALAYVESKWQAQAVSGDGARGIMMLTADTAASLGVTDRDDPQQSILAGARYFVQVRDKIPPRIAEPDRTWFALAAYNVGYGHLEDARVLAQARGRQPDRWSDVSDVLPLLTQEEFFATAKHGYARGWEPAQMVERVQGFLKLLEFQDARLSAGPGAPISTTSLEASK
ncbi:membrane-bound lytic murein transglycosylase MltF, partial [bacterium]